MLVTLGISIISGIIGGWIASQSIFSPPHALFRDDDHFEEVLKRYNIRNLKGNDERLSEALKIFKLVRKHISAKDSLNHDKEHLDELVNQAWLEQNEEEYEILDKKRTKNIINKIIYDIDSSQELTDEAFDQIFYMI